MDRMSASEWQRLSEAMVLWTGWETFAWPHRDDSRLIDRFGAAEAAPLLPKVHEMSREFYLSKAFQVANDFKEMGDMAIADFKRANPDAPEAAMEALAWCYTFDYR